MSEKLKPCPHCGTAEWFKIIKEEIGDNEEEFVLCTMCMSKSLLDDNDLGHNNRPIEDALQAEVDRLREALEKVVSITTKPINIREKEVWLAANIRGEARSLAVAALKDGK